MHAVAAFLLSPIVVALLLPMAMEQSLQIFPLGIYFWTLILVYVLTLVVAVPIYLLLPKHYKKAPLPLAGAAFSAAALSFGALNIPSKATHIQVGTVVQVRDGAYTAQGWANLASTVLLVGTAGGIGGLCFHFIANHRRKQSDA